MKDILKGVTVKIISVIVMIALIVGGGCFAYKYYIGNHKVIFDYLFKSSYMPV